MSKSRKRRNSVQKTSKSSDTRKSSKKSSKSAKNAKKAKIETTAKSKKKKSKPKTKEQKNDYASLFKGSVGNDIEQRIRARILKKRQEEQEEDELLKSSSSSESSIASSDTDTATISAEHSTSAKSGTSSDSNDHFSDPTPPNPDSLGRRASIVASSNVHVSDGDDEGSKISSPKSSKSGSRKSSKKSASSRKSSKQLPPDPAATPDENAVDAADPPLTSTPVKPDSPTSINLSDISDLDDESEKKSKASKRSTISGSMASNRSQLSSKSDLPSLNLENGEEDLLEEKPKGKRKSKRVSSEEDTKDYGEYDDIENQLIQDQEKELAYLNGLDEPINKSDLPLLVPPDQNGPYMNEPMKLRISRLKRTKIWVRNLIVHEPPLVNDDVDCAIKSKNGDLRSQSEDEYNMTAIFDNMPANHNEDRHRKKTLKMETSLKNAILERLKKKS